MTKKYLWILVVFVGIAGLCFWASLYYRQCVDEKLVRGQYAFADLRQKLPLIDKIELSKNGQTITIYRRDDEWRFKQAADYFANTDMLAAFYDMLENAFIIATDEANADDVEVMAKRGSLLKIFADENNLLDEIIIDNDLQKDKSRLAYRQKNSRIYRIGATEAFSADVPSWLKMPLIDLEPDDIAGISIEKTFFSTDVLAEDEEDTDFAGQLFAFLQFLNYEGIATKQEFANIYPELKPQILLVYLKSGLIYQLNFYIAGGNCWLAINLTSEKIMRQNVPEQIKQIKPYYDNWVFLLSAEQKEFLSSFLVL